MTVEKVWTDKIEYKLVVSQNAVIFGAAIDLEINLSVCSMV